MMASFPPAGRVVRAPGLPKKRPERPGWPESRLRALNFRGAASRARTDTRTCHCEHWELSMTGRRAAQLAQWVM